MKNSLLILLFACLALPTQAAWRAQPQPIDGFQLRNLVADGDGYLALVAYERETLSPDNRVIRHTTCALMRMDAQLHPEWETRFPEGQTAPYAQILPLGDRIYLGGTATDAAANETPQMACFDRQGKLLWTKQFLYPGCREGSKFIPVRTIPGGDLLVRFWGTQCSNGKTQIADARIHPDGEIVWVKDTYAAVGQWGSYGPEYVFENGDYLKVCHTWVPQGAGRDSRFELMVQYYDVQTGSTKWSKKVPMAGELVTGGIVRLKNGNFMVTGDFKDVRTGTVVQKSMNCIFSPAMDLLDSQVWTEGYDMRGMGLIPRAGGGFISGSSCKPTEHGTPWVILYEYDADGNRIGEARVETEMRGGLRKAVDGGYFIWSPDKVVWLQEV